MLLIFLFLTFWAFTLQAASPSWEATPYIQARTITIVNNHQKTAGDYYYNITFDDSLSWPTLALSIPKIRLVQSGNELHYKVMISQPHQDKFEMYLMIDPSYATQIWDLDVRYYAIQNSVALVGDYLFVTFFQQNSDALATVTAGSGYRTDTNTESIGAGTFDINNQYEIATFVTGYHGASTDFYQVNISASISSDTDIDIFIEVNNDIALTNLYVYVIIADITGLAVQSRIFVETAITQSSYGDQYSFYTPDRGFQESNYISGMASFSMRDNYQFNLTCSDYAVNDLTFLTSTSSKYDQISHFNLYARKCYAPYTYYSKPDYLCYITCPDTTYVVQSYSVCDPCHYSCQTCVDDTTCDTCKTNRIIVTGNSLCTCKDYYFQSGQTCNACHYSCQTCSDDQYYNCQSCQASMKRSTLDVVDASNQTCPCDTGYEDVGQTRCDQICGDSKVYEDACDDGNTDNNDGCSDECVIEDYFTCDANQPSFCYYDASPNITIAKIQKDINSNIAKFYIIIEPYVPAMATELSTDNFDHNFSLSSKKVQQIGDYIVLSGTYSQDLQGQDVWIGFKPDADNERFSLFNGTNETVALKATDGQRMYIYSASQYQVADQIQIASYYMSCFILGSSLLFSFGYWKTMGNQLYFAVQFAFMSYIASSYFTPHNIAVGKTRYVMGYNEAFGQDTDTQLSQPHLEYMGYSVAYYYNFNIMLILPVVALILYGIYRIVLRMHNKKLKEDDQYDIQFENTNQGKFLQFCQFDFFVYWVFVCMQQILIGLIVQIQNLDMPAIFVYISICMIGICVSIFAVTVKPKSMKTYRKFPYHKFYGNKTFIAVLLATLVMDALLLISILVSFYVFYTLLAFPLAIILYVAIQQPHKSILNNIRLIIVELCLQVVLILQVIAYHTQKSVFLYFPIGYLVCISIAWIVTLVVWIILLVQYLRSKQKYYFDEEQSEHKSIANTSQMSKESDLKQRQDVEKKLKEINYLMFNQKKQGPQLPSVLEMKQVGSTPNSVIKSSRVPKSSARSNIKNQRELQTLFRNRQQGPKSNRSNIPQKSDYLDRSYLEGRNRKASQNREYLGEDYQDSQVTAKMMKSPRSNLRQPMASGARSRKSNIYQDILDSTVSRYK